MRNLTTVLILAAGLPLLAAPAHAQDRPRVTVSVNGGYQPSVTEFDDSFTFELNRETGTTRVSYPVDAGGLFDAGFGVRLWGGLGVGAVFSRFNVDGAAEASSSIPHPFFFNRHREVSGEADITRQENAGHIQAQFALPRLSGLQIVVMGGPSIFDIRQTVVTNVRFTETFPYDTAEFAGVDSREVTGTAYGFHAGVDVAWMFTRNVGVGGILRFSRAEIDLPVEGRTIAVDAGGTHVGAGIRVAF